MAVKNVGEKYRCSICGNEVIVTKVGGGELFDLVRRCSPQVAQDGSKGGE